MNALRGRRRTRLRWTLRRVRAVRTADLTAAWWTVRALRSIRGDLERDGVRARVIPPPVRVRRGMEMNVRSLLRLMRATCLERSLVVQAALRSQDRLHPVAVGVRHVDGEVKAHAWVVGFDDAREARGFTELTRIQPCDGR